MLFGVYCNSFNETNLTTAKELIKLFEDEGHEFILYTELKGALDDYHEHDFHDNQTLQEGVQALLTIGGDGTILNAVQFIYGTNIPVLGINTGRLGFLTSVAIEEVKNVLHDLENDLTSREERSLLYIETSEGYEGLALNELSVLKKDSSSMITIHAFLNEEFLNSYWADGLIISTTTGSTAYSMSCGGPIVVPGSGNFIITPISPHNLNVRPLVISDSCVMKLNFETRSNDLLMAIDTSSRIIPDEISIEIRKADHNISLLRPSKYSYLETLRSKLNWGFDRRN